MKFTRERTIAAVTLVVAATLAYTLKRHYSVARADDLRWVLAPTTWLVELFTGHTFEFESGAGYESRALMFVIAAPCAGVNFLIAAFATGVIGFLSRATSLARAGALIGVTAAVAYALTLVVNASRIALALAIRSTDLAHGWLTADRIHRIEGIAVYFGAISLAYVLASVILKPTKIAP